MKPNENQPAPLINPNPASRHGQGQNELNQEVARIPLGNGRFALVDASDEARVLAHGSWHATEARGQTYASHLHWFGKDHKPQKRQIYLHRFVMGAPHGSLVMHRNGDGLDCRKDNLLFGDHQKNGASHRRKQGVTSRFRGVSRNIGRGKPWQAFIVVGGETKYLGRFDTEEEAARAYNQNALLHFGEHASLNKV